MEILTQETYSLVINSSDKLSGNNNNGSYQINWDDFLPRRYSTYKAICNFQSSGGNYKDQTVTFTSNTGFSSNKFTTGFTGTVSIGNSATFTATIYPTINNLTYVVNSGSTTLLTNSTLVVGYTITGQYIVGLNTVITAVNSAYTVAVPSYAIVNGSNALTLNSGFLFVGMTITGTGIPANTTIIGGVGNLYTLSANATVTASNITGGTASINSYTMSNSATGTASGYGLTGYNAVSAFMNVTAASANNVLVPGVTVTGANIALQTVIVSTPANAVASGTGGVGLYYFNVGTLAGGIGQAITVNSTFINVTAVTNGKLTVGTTLSCAGLPVGTTITSFGTGTGGIGTYNISTYNTSGYTAGVALTGANNVIDLTGATLSGSLVTGTVLTFDVTVLGAPVGATVTGYGSGGVSGLGVTSVGTFYLSSPFTYSGYQTFTSANIITGINNVLQVTTAPANSLLIPLGAILTGTNNNLISTGTYVTSFFSASTGGIGAYYLSQPCISSGSGITNISTSLVYNGAKITLNNLGRSYSFDTSTKSPSLTLGYIQRDIQTSTSSSNSFSCFYLQNAPRTIQRPNQNVIQISIYNSDNNYANLLTDTTSAGVPLSDMSSWSMIIEFIPLTTSENLNRTN